MFPGVERMQLNLVQEIFCTPENGVLVPHAEPEANTETV